MRVLLQDLESLSLGRRLSKEKPGISGLGRVRSFVLGQILGHLNLKRPIETALKHGLACGLMMLNTLL